MSDDIIAKIDELIEKTMERHPPRPPPPAKVVPKAGTKSGVRTGTNSSGTVFCGYQIPDIQTQDHRGPMEVAVQPRRQAAQQSANPRAARFTLLRRGVM
jgi:hypothetical protein